jgi:hypothetical protein
MEQSDHGGYIKIIIVKIMWDNEDAIQANHSH